MSVILDPNGQAISAKTVETTLAPILVEMLSHLEEALRQSGLTLTCFKCRSLGLPDLAQGGNADDSQTLTITCSCSRRTYDRRSGRARVFIN